MDKKIQTALFRAIKKIQVAEKCNNMVEYEKGIKEYEEIQKKCRHTQTYSYTSGYFSVVSICEDCDKTLEEFLE